ncbi:transposable element Tcb2 transposase [Trichonephila clavipes]|nr:transposable element Tcb2 transposase [Trichonephila clavipes]
MQPDCALRIAGTGRLTSFSVECKTGVGTSESVRSHLHENQVQDALNRPVDEKTATSPVSSRTIRRRLAEGHLGSRRPLCGLPLTPTHRRLRLQWWRARGNCTVAEWNQVVFSNESRFNLSSDDNRVRLWRPSDERLNPVFALQRHTAPADGMGCHCLQLPPLVLIRGTMIAQRYVHDILQPHVLPLMQRLPGAIFQQDNARPHTTRVSEDCLRTVATLPWPA